MNISIGALLRSMVQRGLNDGLAYNQIYRAVRESGVSVTSSVFSQEYRYAQGLTQGFVDFRQGGLSSFRDRVPDAASITESPVNWPDRFNVRVQLFGRDTETGQFTSRYINIGYDRLPTYGTIADTAAVMAVLGSEHYEFTFGSVTGMTIESAPLQGEFDDE